MGKGRKARTYQYDSTIIDQVASLSAEREVWPSDLVNLALKRALSEIAAGRWQISRRAVKFAPTFADSEAPSRLDQG